MNVRSRQDLRPAIAGNPMARAIRSNGWPQGELAVSAVGRAPSPIPQCIPRPQWLKLLPHYFIPKIPFSATAFPLKIRWTPIDLDSVQPDRLNPGYIDTTQALHLDPNLDTALQDLMSKLGAGQSPFDQYPYNAFVKGNGKIRVALVDLSTEPKLLFPKIAEYDSDKITYGASLSKIGALYAAYQLRFDLGVQARMKPQSMTANRIRALRTMFDIARAGQPPVWTFNFNTSFRKALNAICHNPAAQKIIDALGLTYIASALWQAGLYDCRRGGVWLGSNYGGRSWHRDPIGNQTHGVTALAVATFFTLLAQGRLIDDQSSNGIKGNLVQQHTTPGGCRSFFEEGLRGAGRFMNSDTIHSKIGIYWACPGKGSPYQAQCARDASHALRYWYHEGALIDRVHNGQRLRYVAVVLTDAPTFDGGYILPDLIAKFDELIRTNP